MPRSLRRVRPSLAALALVLSAVLSVALVPGPFGAARAQGPAPYLMSTEEAVLLQQAQDYLNSVRSLRGRFQQASSTGNQASGTVYMRRPGRMRIEYDPPAEVLVVANGSYVIYEDGELQQVSYIGLGDTPLGILLRDEVKLSDPAITVTGMRRQAGLMEVDIVETDAPGQGTLTLVFAESPLELRSWRVRDAQNVEVTVNLLRPRFNIDLDRDLFSYRERAGFRRSD
ncbi:LolA family protein [Roseospira visakhapatnamensis]|uniref:Outer membrane lipoprotein-sorting protein n=1 Tax=Roseospira visakhapatnamensis TaxID=390880 RepID=A0A7W6RGR6_9PROT|nr:outer membrane lipoprotein carrier protein LolA [Roseospira visakhapatnamensis]MBB4268253.1 outer membrane lipoprotein-sorting protein [Roseospira visakhapatnamensis]